VSGNQRKAADGTAPYQADTSPSEPAISNVILSSIPDEEYQIILPSLEPVTLARKCVLHQANEPIEYGYFPNGGIISFLVPVSEGRSTEVGMVGREGLVGAALAGGLDRSTHVALVQVGGTAMRIPASRLTEILPWTRRLGALLTRYALIQGMQVAQTAACNRLHNLEQRLARWLLMSQDRVGTNSLPYTQKLLASMLGTDRPSVSIAIGALQKTGCMKQHRGYVEIIDRTCLESSVCECYRVVEEYNRKLDSESRGSL